MPDETFGTFHFPAHLICYTRYMFLRGISRLLAFVLLISAGAEAGDTRTPAEMERIGPFGGDVRSLLINAANPQVVYIGTSSGTIYRSSDGGRSWGLIHPGIGRLSFVIDTLVQHPTEPNHIYAGAWDRYSEGGGLFESTDAGTSWKQVALPVPSLAVRDLSICRSRPEIMIAGTLSGAYVTVDGGQTWKQVGGKVFEKAESVAIDPVNPDLLYVGTWRLGYKSSDFGKTWIRVDKGMPLDSDVFSIAISAKNPAVVYSSACSGVYRSSNRAQTWSRLRVHPARFTIRAQVVYIDPADPSTVYTGTTEGLFVSNDNGVKWRRLTSSNVTVNAIQVDPGNNRRILIGTEYQGVLLSEDRGKNWSESNRGFIHKQISWIVPDSITSGSFIAGVGSGRGGLYSYDSRTDAWQSSFITPGTRVLSFLILPGTQGKLAGTAQGLYWQAGNSSTWTKLKGAVAKRTVYSLALDAGGTVVYAGTDLGIYRSPLSSLDFRVPPQSRLSPKVWCITPSKTTPGLVYAGSSLGLMRSWDKGTTWSVISSYGLPNRAMIRMVAISPSNKDNLFAATSSGLYKSENGGVHWKRVNDGRLGLDVSSIVFLGDTGERVVSADGSSGGIYYSRDGGETWEKVSSEEYDSPVYCLVTDPENPTNVYAGTRSFGIYRFELR